MVYIKLLNTGPTIGYYPEPSKCCLFVNKDRDSKAHQLFYPIGVRIVPWHGLLGGVIGDPGGVDSFVQKRLYEWSTLVESIITVAKTQPLAAYLAFFRSVQSEWIFLQRVLQHCGPLFVPLEEIISQKLLPTIFGSKVFLIQRELFSLSSRMCGLNILNSTDIN